MAQEKKPDFDLMIMLVVIEVLINRGVNQSAAVTIATEVAKGMTARYGGLQLYVARNVAKDTAGKAAEIYAEFDGHNHEELARKHGYSTVWIRQLLKKVKSASRASE